MRGAPRFLRLCYISLALHRSGRYLHFARGRFRSVRLLLERFAMERDSVKARFEKPRIERLGDVVELTQQNLLCFLNDLPQGGPPPNDGCPS